MGTDGTLGDWCKWLEKNFSPEIMIPELPVIIRLDGNNFSNWTKGLEKPFDDNLMTIMIEVTKALVEETNAVIGYTQSDEITLFLYSRDRKHSIYHDGKKQKILSKLTAKATMIFDKLRKKYLPKHDKVAIFDCRIYQTPSLGHGINQILWRELDATKNSISMVAQHHFSHSQLNKVNTNQMQEMLFTEKGINWNDLSSSKKRGTYIKRTVVTKKFTTEDIESLPPKHAARKNPDLEMTRSIISQVEFPILSSLENRVGVLLFDEEPDFGTYEKEVDISDNSEVLTIVTNLVV